MSEGNKDILTALKRSGDAVFLLKRWNPLVAYSNGIKLTVKELAPMVEKSTRVRQAVEKISEEDPNATVQFLDKCVRSYLEEIGHYRSILMIRTVGVCVCKFFKNNYTGIIVNEKSILKVKDAMGPNPVIFAPSHRSYGDFILMSFLCFYYNFEIPAIAAGNDFKDMFCMGSVLRSCCAFYMRRTFGANDLYKATFREYVNLLVTRGESALEFFIEGTRSRTGKSLVPKFGFLTMALEPYFRGMVPDVTIIPINITYERTLEEQLFAGELLGVPKPKESTKLLVRAYNYLDENYGRIFVDFGDPISVKEKCISEVGDARRILNQTSFVDPSSNLCPEVEEICRSLGYSIVHEQNKLATFMTFNMLAASLSVWSAFEDSVPVLKVTADIRILQNTLEKLGSTLHVTEALDTEIERCLKVHGRIVHLDQAALWLKKQNCSTFGVSDTQLKGYRLKDSTLSQVYPVMVLQQYANAVCMKCFHIAVLLISLYSSNREYLRREQLFAEYKVLRNIFSFEFALRNDGCAEELNDFEAALANLKNLRAISRAETIITTGEKVSLEETFTITNNEESYSRDVLIMGLLYPFFIGYMVTIKLCYEAAKNEAIKQNDLQVMVQRTIEESLYKETIHSYSLSLNLISNAISAFVVMGALLKETK